MFTSFSTALSALDATSTAIDVVGNNLANLNTPGFKDSTTYFRDLVTESLGAGLGETQVGFGTGTPMTIRQFTQGAIQSSSGLLDAAIAGDGFFVVSNAQGNQLYTRAGSFQVDDTGTLRTNTGEAGTGMDHAQSNHGRRRHQSGHHQYRRAGGRRQTTGGYHQPDSGFEPQFGSRGRCHVGSCGDYQGLRYAGHQSHADYEF